jgi:hypothetical protein
MSPLFVLFVFIAACWLIWIFVSWLSARLRDSVAIAGAAAAIYAVSFFVVTAFAVYMYGFLAGARSGILPPAFSTPTLVLAIALIIALPGYATYRFFHLCRHRQHKPPTVRRVMGRKPPTVRRVPQANEPPRPRP